MSFTQDLENIIRALSPVIDLRYRWKRSFIAFPIIGCYKPASIYYHPGGVIYTLPHSIAVDKEGCEPICPTGVSELFWPTTLLSISFEFQDCEKFLWPSTMFISCEQRYGKFTRSILASNCIIDDFGFITPYNIGRYNRGCTPVCKSFYIPEEFLNPNHPSYNECVQNPVIDFNSKILFTEFAELLLAFQAEWISEDPDIVIDGVITDVTFLSDVTDITTWVSPETITACNCTEYPGMARITLTRNNEVVYDELVDSFPYNDTESLVTLVQSEEFWSNCGLRGNFPLQENPIYNVIRSLDPIKNCITFTVLDTNPDNTPCEWNYMVRLINCTNVTPCSGRTPGWYTTSDFFGFALSKVTLLPPLNSTPPNFSLAILANNVLKANGYDTITIKNNSNYSIKNNQTNQTLPVEFHLCECPPGKSWSVPFQTCV